MKQSLLEYYSRRAQEYESIYDKPERKTDLEALTSVLQNALAGEDVLEIACGTGYWTARLARVARSICATDAAAEPLELARCKNYLSGRVRLELADAYTPSGIPGHFTAGFAGFWWSHVPQEKLSHFIDGLHRRLGVGARVVFCDNRYVEGSSTPVHRVDAAGNSYQRRWLANGEEYEVLKNFPTPVELNRHLNRTGAAEISLTELTYYWCVTYRVGAVTLNHWS